MHIIVREAKALHLKNGTDTGLEGYSKDSKALDLPTEDFETFFCKAVG